MWSIELGVDFTDRYYSKINNYYKKRNFQLYERTVRQLERAAYDVAEKRFNEIREAKSKLSLIDRKFMDEAFGRHFKSYHKFRAASMAYSELRERDKQYIDSCLNKEYTFRNVS